MRKRLLFLAFAILFVFTISAQETTSDIAGRVTGSNNPLPGATVTAVHIPSGSTYKTTSRSDGQVSTCPMCELADLIKLPSPMSGMSRPNNRILRSHWVRNTKPILRWFLKPNN